MKINMKNLIITSILVLGLVIASRASAAWAPPTAEPTGNNTPSPINVGALLQEKLGTIVAGGLQTLVFKLDDGNQAENFVMVSDADGFGSWVDPNSLGLGGGDGWWDRDSSTSRVNLLNINDDIGIGDETVIYKDGLRFLHSYGDNNIFMGNNAGNFTTGGKNNIGIGNNAAISLGSAAGGQPSANVAIGNNALNKNTTANDNVAIGSNALYNNDADAPNGGGNVALGASALWQQTNGNLNVAIGFSALSSNLTGDDLVAIGRTANVSSGNLSNAIVIGASADVDSSNKVRIGNSLISEYETQVPWTTGSDKRFKKNIQDLDLGLDFINSLHPVSYQMKSEASNEQSFGFIAQEVEEILDGREAKLISTQNTEDAMKYMRYNDLIAPIVNAIQEQQEEIDSLEARILELENIIKDLKK